LDLWGINAYREGGGRAGDIMIPLILMGESRAGGRPGLAFDEGYSAQRLAIFLGFKSPREMRAVVALHDVDEFKTPGEAWRFVAECGVTHLLVVGLKAAKFMRLKGPLGTEQVITAETNMSWQQEPSRWRVHCVILPHPSATSPIWNDIDQRRHWMEQYRRFYEEARRSDFIESAGIVRGDSTANDLESDKERDRHFPAGQ
jgi:hypothetical protein